MSINNFKRATLNNETDSRAYRVKSTTPEKYWDEGLSFHKSKGRRTWKKIMKEICQWQVRVYRTWKYNRKTQYK